MKKEKMENNFPIIAIGASAGGLEALGQFFKNMPAVNGMGFVVIQHLDPDHVGMMPELLQRNTSMKVTQVRDGLNIIPNNIYIIPPNKTMSILNGVLHLFDPVESRGLRLPIDFFFRSLANDKGERSIGIILSGMGSDGSLGIKAIKERNGIVLVQDPTSAKFDGMPRSAIHAVVPDIIASAVELPIKLIDLLNFYQTNKAKEKVKKESKSSIDKIIILIRDQTGHDFSLYKKNTIFRRIERRKGIHQIENIKTYVRFLQENPKEIDILFKELLIGVTNFFRDTSVWEILKEKVIPSLINELPNHYIVRAWVVGCSTGEEAYSLAITFNEVIEKLANKKKISLQIFATDLDTDAIDRARKGYFSKNILNDVSLGRIKRYFKPIDDGFIIKTFIREMIVFAPQNVIKDPPFTKLDIITCRNLLIYMESELQKKIVGLFSYSLKPKGILVLGTSESLGSNNEAFNEIDAKNKIFERSENNTLSNLIDFPSSFYRTTTMTSEKKTTKKVIENIQALTDQILIQRFTPASVLINENGDILYITGHTGDFLEPAAGKANWNIYAMAREGLRNELHSAIHKVSQNFDPIVINNVKIEKNGEPKFVDVTFQCLESPEQIKGTIVIVFSDLKDIKQQESTNLKSKKSSSSGREKELELELQRRNDDIQSVREQMQTSQEELKSTNEELQSTNEELQSTNEELTTSKEEMQSLNEELQTVNLELQSKVNDYERINADMKNLLNSTEIATLFLDKELNIRRYTDAVTKIIKLRTVDLGRPLTDIATYLQYPEFEEHSKLVLKTLNTSENTIATNDKKWFSVRIMPYRTLDDRIDGLVITFTDITASKLLEIKLTDKNETLNKNL
jgi:two-component system CheB/CheR fusion protein